MQFQGKKLRNELKYYLHHFEYTDLRSKISRVLDMDRNSKSINGYGIRSLYFDSPHNHAIYDKNNGIFHREKYRIRIYNGSDQSIKLERKSKYGDYICKESVNITRLDYDSIIIGDYNCLNKKDNPLIMDFYSALTYRAFTPTVIVDYIREAYIYEHGNVRITFDKRLAAGVNSTDLFNPHLVVREVLMAPQTILEIKYDEFLPDHIRKLLQPEKLVRSAISKYVLCREEGFIHYNR